RAAPRAAASPSRMRRTRASSRDVLSSGSDMGANTPRGEAQARPLRRRPGLRLYPSCSATPGAPRRNRQQAIAQPDDAGGRGQGEVVEEGLGRLGEGGVLDGQPPGASLSVAPPGQAGYASGARFTPASAAAPPCGPGEVAAAAAWLGAWHAPRHRPTSPLS